MDRIERDIAICELYKAGGEIGDIQRKLRSMRKQDRGRAMALRSIHAILHANKIPLRERDRTAPVPRKYPKDPQKRDVEIHYLHEDIGCSMGDIATAYGLSSQRVLQIVHDVRRGHVTQRPMKVINRQAVTLPKAAAGEASRTVTAGRASLERRLKLNREIGEDYARQQVERERCRRDFARFVNCWGWTYDPRRVPDEPAWMPFDLFPRQVEMANFIFARARAQEDGLIEKSRDVGFTWVLAAFAAHQWLFEPGFQTRIGSHKEAQVDNIGDMDSIFEKIRSFIYRLPRWLMPKGFFSPDHDNFLRIINPDNGNTITGAGGDEIGRGGRATVLFLDEAAHIERADRIDASTSGTTNCRIWASSVNGMGNLFARKRHTGVLRPNQIFRFHWRDDPRKTPAWAEQKQRELKATPWAWAAEFEIDYSASVEGVCIHAAHVDAAVRLGQILHDRAKAAAEEAGFLVDEAQLRYVPPSTAVAGLDIGGGKAASVYICRRGPLVEMPETWGNPDTTETAYRALDFAKRDAILTLYFDEVGIGKGVLSTLQRADKTGVVTRGINVGTSPSMTIWEDEKTSRQKFSNLKAELWWIMRERFRLTWEHVNFLDGAAEEAVEHELSDLVVLPKDAIELRTQLSLPRFFRNETGKVIIETKIQMMTRGIASPDQADALALTFVPGDDDVPIIMPGICDTPIRDRWAPDW